MYTWTVLASLAPYALIVLGTAIYLLSAVLRARRAEADLRALQNTVRNHRDMRGDDRCWIDDEVLYNALPEGYVPPDRDSRVELKLCEQFITCRHNPNTEYVSPQRRVEELEAHVEVLQRSLIFAAERIAAQSELLSQRATNAQ